MNDGLHFNVPFADYLRWPIMSQSSLKEGRNSMAHLAAAVDGERVKVPTDDMVLGSAMHLCFLEPDQAFSRIATWDGAVRRGKVWDAFCESNAGKLLLTVNQSEKLTGMIASLRRHPEVRRWLSKIEHVEVSAVGLVHGLRMKGRCDALTSEPLIDLKKVSDGAQNRILRTVLDYGYHIQGWIYGQLFERERFLILTVEDEPPFDCVAYEMSPALLRQGKREACELIDRVLECQAAGVWPGRSDAVCMLELPEWAADSVVTFEGELL